MTSAGNKMQIPALVRRNGFVKLTSNVHRCEHVDHIETSPVCYVDRYPCFAVGFITPEPTTVEPTIEPRTKGTQQSKSAA